MKTAVSLADARILVTRPQPEADALGKLIHAHGGQAIILPTIAIEEIDITTEVQRQCESMSAYHAAIFVSKNAVRWALHKDINIAHLAATVQIIAIGPATAESLLAAACPRVQQANEASSEALLKLPILDSAHISGQQIAIFSGRDGRDLLARTLSARGAIVHIIEVYKRVRPVIATTTIKKIWDNGTQPDIIVLTSGECLQNLYDMTPAVYRVGMLTKKTVVISERIATLSKALGFQLPAIIAAGTRDTDLLRALANAHHGESII